LAAAGLGSGLSARTAFGQTYWNPQPNDNAGGVWDTTTVNWADVNLNPVLWPNVTSTYAEFGDTDTAGGVGTGGLSSAVVTVSNTSSTTDASVGGIITGGLDFEVNGFNISGPGVIDFGGTNASVYTAGGVSAIISAVMTNGSVTYSGPGSGGNGVTYVTGANTYPGATQIAGNDVLAISSISNSGVAGTLGASSNASSNLVFNGSGSNLTYTGGTATTDRGFSLAAGDDFIRITGANTVLTFTGAVTAGSVGVNSFYKNGPGTLQLTNNAVQLSSQQNVFLQDGGIVLTGSGTNAIITAPSASIGSLFIGNQSYTPAATDTVAYMNVSGGSTTSVEHVFIGEGNNAGVNNVAVLNVIGPGTTFITQDSSGLGEGGTASNVGTGILNVSSGATFLSKSSDFRIAETDGTIGTVNVTGNSSLNISNGSMYVGSGNNVVGSYNQTSGSSYVGNTFIAGGTGSVGTLSLGNGSSGSVTYATFYIQGLSGNSTVYYNGVTVVSPPTNGGQWFAPVTHAYIGAGGLTLDSAGTDSSVDQNLVPSPTSAGGGLTKVGADSVTLSLANTYTGDTVITGGTLYVDGSTLSTGTVRVASGGTLAGNGSVGSVIVAGTITGTALDVENTGNLYMSKLTTGPETWNGSGGYSVLLGTGNASSKLVMSGLTIQATPGLPFLIAPTSTGNSSLGSVYVIATDTTATTDPYASAIATHALTLSPTTVAPTDGSGFALVSQVDSGGGYDLLLEDVATPEPTTLALLGLATVPLLSHRKGRRWARSAT
jgi:fibronectin-binding autotransporter adhesin